MNRSAVIVFDVGSTLIHPNFTKLAEWLRSKVGVIRSPGEVECAFRMAVSGNIYGVQSDQQQADIFFASCNVESGSQETLSYWQEIATAGGKNSWLYTHIDPEAHFILEELQKAGAQLVAASNSDGTLQDELDSAGLSQYFKEIFDSSAIGVEKPSEEFYVRVLDPFRGTYSVHVGDDLVKDCIAASAAGFHRTLLYDPCNIYRGLPSHTKIGRLSLVLDVVLNALSAKDMPRRKPDTSC